MMRSKQSLWSIISCWVVIALVAAGCAPAATAVPPSTSAPQATTAPQDTAAPQPTLAPTAAAAAGTATITFVQEPDSLNPWYTQMFFAQILTQFYLKSLWSFDTKNQPVPEIAAEIPSSANGGVSADGKTITVKLRSDVTWSDGEPVTADDFVFTYNMIVSDKNVVQSRYPYEDFVDTVTAPDPQTLVINFKGPFAPWLTTVFSYVLPKHVLQPVFDADGTLDNAAWNKAPTVGVGPYVFKEWQSGSHIIFTANPKWIKPAHLEQIFIRIVPDDAAQEAAILAGDTDIGVFLSSDQIARLEGPGKVDVVANPSGYDEGWFLNVNPATANPAMLELNVRKALALATDRFTLVNDLLDPTINPVNATFWDATSPFGDPSLKPYPYDPAEAQRLLDGAGWKDTNGDGIRDKDGKELILRYATNTRELRKNYQAVVQQQLKSVGIGVELANYSSD
ncbi:MAG: peptide ABC transporter substrate-binding protein, partial [Anaerolineales bacterium]